MCETTDKASHRPRFAVGACRHGQAENKQHQGKREGLAATFQAGRHSEISLNLVGGNPRVIGLPGCYAVAASIAKADAGLNPHFGVQSPACAAKHPRSTRSSACACGTSRVFRKTFSFAIPSRLIPSPSIVPPEETLEKRIVALRAFEYRLGLKLTVSEGVDAVAKSWKYPSITVQEGSLELALRLTVDSTKLFFSTKDGEVHLLLINEIVDVPRKETGQQVAPSNEP